MGTLRESTVAVVARNETWSAGSAATEPYEAGWASEAAIFVRALEDASGSVVGGDSAGTARVEISPDGMHWVAEGTTFALPARKDGIGVARVGRFGHWLRVVGELPAGVALKVVVTMQLK
jgi:hypothetical protein